MIDLILRGGTVVDGTGKAALAADVAVAAGRIIGVGDYSAEAAGKIVDVSGKVVAPGFIDVHVHTDGWLRKFPNFEVKTRQGYTTEILMADGISYAPMSSETASEWLFYLRTLNGLEEKDYSGWKSIANYMSAFENNCAQNTGTHIPYSNVRSLFCGFQAAPPTANELSKIQNVIREGMEQGAVGLSTGLEYLGQTYATVDELVSACKAVKPFGGIYVTHIRYPIGMLPALKEAVEIGRKAGVRVHISHLKSIDPNTADQIFEYFETQEVKDVELTFDVYPYAASSTMLSYLLPYGCWNRGAFAALDVMEASKPLRAEFESNLAVESPSQAYVAWLPSEKNRSYIGRPLKDYITESGLSASDALLRLLREENLQVLLVFRRGIDTPVNRFVSHSRAMLGSDGVYQPGGAVHPRMFGSVARMLGPLVRDEKALSLPEAVKKMTSFSAERFGLKHRGRIEAGYFADLTVFDPSTISDRATYDNPTEPSIGVEHVITNGKLIVENAKPVSMKNGEWPGRYLKYNA